jgi:RNA polymerase sigma factor (TIGR02999 family)
MDQSPVTVLMEAARAGDVGAARALWEEVYQELRKMAQVQMLGERRDHTLQATALVNEAFARLVGARGLVDEGAAAGGGSGGGGMNWASRAQFFFAAGEAMRRVLVEHARARGRLKRGGDGEGRAAVPLRLPPDALRLLDEPDDPRILALDEAVRRLESEEPEVAAVVRLRFFAGLSGDQTAAALGVSARQVDRLWAYARARLYRAIEAEGKGG